jgi:hypothetical protein
MLSFEKWKLMNESLGGFPLGVKTPGTIGVVGSNEIVRPLDFETELEEAKKCFQKKKMNGDISDIVSKKHDIKVKDDDEEADVDADVKVKDDDEEADVDADVKVKDDDEEADVDADVKVKDDDEEADVDADVKVKDEKPTLFQKKKQKKSMKKEWDEKYRSLHNQLSNGLPGQKYWDGLSEDAVYAPKDPNQGLGNMNPETPLDAQPGEVGFAPSGRVATGFGN